MNRQDIALIRQAIGRVDGDTITLANQWATVVITFDISEPTKVPYVVTGDIRDLRVSSKRFANASLAMSYALASLAEYQKGALNR